MRHYLYSLRVVKYCLLFRSPSASCRNGILCIIKIRAKVLKKKHLPKAGARVMVILITKYRRLLKIVAFMQFAIE